jgi:hypothetical protein
MAGPFDLPGMMKNLNRISEPRSPAMPALQRPDTRSRAERREDFEKELASLDRVTIENLRDKLLESSKDDDLKYIKEDLENALIKFIRFYDKFEDLNSDESRKVALKEKELILEAKHDWKEKFRLFFFRVLGSALLIITLFFIGYIEHEYDWARLPMSKYLNTSAKLP